MSRYRKLDPRFWNDEKVRTLSDDGKLAFLFLLTHPHMTALGAMRASLDGLAAELGWSAKRFQSAVGPAIQLGMVEHDAAACFISLPRFLRYNEPEGPNSVTKAWREALDLVPECPGKRRLIARCRAYLDAKSDAFRLAMGDAIWDAFHDASPEPWPIPEQEQEQDTCSSGAHAPVGFGASNNGSRSRKGRATSEPHDAAFDAFYAAYPRHEAKQGALRAWRALRVSEGLSEQITTALAAHKRRWHQQATPLDKIPLPGTWLNDRRWEDELPAPSPDPYAEFPRA